MRDGGPVVVPFGFVCGGLVSSCCFELCFLYFELLLYCTDEVVARNPGPCCAEEGRGRADGRRAVRRSAARQPKLEAWLWSRGPAPYLARDPVNYLPLLLSIDFLGLARPQAHTVCLDCSQF